MNPNMLPAFFSSSWATFVLGRAEWSFLSAGDLALPNLIPAFAEDDNIGLFFSSCREGESMPLVVSTVLVRGGNMRERIPSARSEQMRHSECSDIRHSDRTFLLHFWNKLGENNNFGMSIVKKNPILNKILISQNFVSEA
jgi:hypothetical protein